MGKLTGEAQKLQKPFDRSQAIQGLLQDFGHKSIQDGKNRGGLLEPASSLEQTASMQQLMLTMGLEGNSKVEIDKKNAKDS